MIKKLTLQNFQSHRKTAMELAPGVNVIIGSSDCGKSAILRALRWVVNNRPSGDSFRSNWGGDTYVSIETEEGMLSRIRTNTFNGYTLKGAEFAAIKTDIPDEVGVFLNMDEINIQKQLDAPFLLSSTAGEIASHFNKIAHLHKIDSSIKNIQSWIRKLSQDIDNKTNLLETYNKQLEEFSQLEKIEINVEVLESMEKKVSNKKTFRVKLKSIISQLEKLSTEMEEKAGVLKAENQITILTAKFSTLQQNRDKVSILNRKLADLDVIIKKGHKLRDFVKSEVVINSIIELTGKFSGIEEQKRNLKKMMNVVNDCQVLQVRITNILKEAEIEFAELMPDICPLCDSPIKKIK